MKPGRSLAIVLGGCAVGLIAGWALGCGLDLTGSLDVTPADGELPPDGREGGRLPDGAPIEPGDGAVPPNAGGDAAGLPPTTVVLASAGAVAAPTGNAQQTHLIYAIHSQRWWLFAIDSTALNALHTYSSPDFVTWTTGASLTLPLAHGSIGGNFSVAYADLGGTDVVHVGISHRIIDTDRRHFHTRATISAGTITWGTPAQVVAVTDPALTIDPDGCATVIAADGRVMDLTGWAPYGGNDFATGNASSYASINVDTGATWALGFGTRKDIEVETRTVNARIAIPTGGAGVVSLWEGAENEPSPLNVRWARWDGTTWGSQGSVFATNTPQGANDWAAVRLANGEIHAVRRTNAGAYEHRKLVGTTWSAGQAVPAMAGATNGGVVLLALANRMLLLTIANDATSSVVASAWSGSAWGAWAVLDGSSATRSFLSGHASASGNAAVVWSEPTGGNMMRVVGRRVIF